MFQWGRTFWSLNPHFHIVYKIQKSLELKAEEAKLITTLNLLKETKNLVHLSANKEWLVGIKQGTETDKKGSEDYQYCVNVILFDDVR